MVRTVFLKHRTIYVWFEVDQRYNEETKQKKELFPKKKRCPFKNILLEQMIELLPNSIIKMTLKLV